MAHFKLALLALALGGCVADHAPPVELAGDPAPSDTGSDDANIDGDAGGSGVPHLGSEATLEIATWNLNNFPSQADTAAQVAALITAMDVDLVAVQEIADAAAFNALVAALPGYASVLSTHEYGPGNYQKTGFVYRQAVLTLSSPRLLFTADSYAFPRPPLEVDVDLLRADGSHTTLVAINVHLKAGITADDETRRRNACVALEAHLDTVRAGGEPEIIVLGDFNDDLDDPAADNVFTAFLDAPAEYTTLTAPLAAAGELSYLTYPHLYDYQIVTTALDALGGVAQVVPIDELVAYDYAATISDHRPVVSILQR